ncbi:MAG: aldehyde dehydrogenase family protein [Myxococcales bacterium]|nr:aldehyde dehydrogenase family protein [Myxococcales bacterium]
MDVASSFPEPTGLVDLPPRVDAATYLCDGRVIPWSGETREVVSPIATRAGDAFEPVVLGREASLGEAEALAAVAAAERAWDDGFGDWPAASMAERVVAVERFASALEERADAMAAMLMYEIGKSRDDSLKEVVRSVEYMRETVVELTRLDGAGVITGKKGSTTHYARELRRPIGVVLCVAPFNYPVNEFLTTVIPALVMGNVVIGKLPRFGMLANLVAAPAFAECFPPGAISLLPGDGRAVITPLMKATREKAGGEGRHAAIDVLAFIGTEGAANAILGYHPSPISLHKVLGLGSKNAAIVLPGADHHAVAAKVAGGALGFNGQRCTAEKIVFVPRSDAEAFVEVLAARVAERKVGMPWVDGVAITPLPEGPDKIATMRAYLDDAVQAGARIVHGGAAAHTLIQPAVLAGVDARMRIFHEEQFGPIVPVVAYDQLDEVVAWQRSSPFGQQAGIWGPRAEAAKLAHTMTSLVSRVNLNDVCQRGPDSFGFTATDKSGFGVLSLREALLTFSRPVLVQSTDVAAVSAP